MIELGVPVSAYIASASVIGLAVGFGSQGTVQDFVVGLTLIFSDVFNVGDLIDAGGQTGRVHSVGLRHTVLSGSGGKKIYLVNRTIGQINRYPENLYNVFVDLEIPEGIDEDALTGQIASVTQGLRHQFPQLIRSEPEISDAQAVGTAQWEYLRIGFSLWPGQTNIVESTYRNRLLTVLREYKPDYPDWKVTVTPSGS